MRFLFQNSTFGVNGVKAKSFVSVTIASFVIVFLSFFVITPAFLHSHLVNNTLSKNQHHLVFTASVLEGITDVVSSISNGISSVSAVVAEIVGVQPQHNSGIWNPWYWGGGLGVLGSLLLLFFVII